LPSIEGFAQPFKEACNKHSWKLDLTCRAAGDCLWHSAVIFHGAKEQTQCHCEAQNPSSRPSPWPIASGRCRGR
jgi:hypothetical protein